MPKKAKAKVPQISFKYTKKNGGEVDLHLPGFENKPVPEELEQVLEEYGFVHDCGTDDLAVYVDGLAPTGDSFDEELCLVALHVPLCVMTQVIKGKRARKTRFEVQLIGAPIGKAEGATGEALYEAFCKAYGNWQKAGRLIGGVHFITAFQGAVDRVNKELIKKARSKK